MNQYFAFSTCLFIWSIINNRCESLYYDDEPDTTPENYPATCETGMRIFNESAGSEFLDEEVENITDDGVVTESDASVDYSDDLVCCSGYRQNRYYESDGKLIFECLPVCLEECPSGVCVEPGQCKRVGEFDEDRCDVTTCKNGCLSDDSCLCLYGYEKINSSDCTPIAVTGSSSRDDVCTKSCENGACVIGPPDTCSCSVGYRLSEYNDSVCEPFCDPQCHPNGACVRPNVCECRDGFATVSNSVDAVPSCVKCDPSVCANGVCVDGTCVCHSGYEYVNETCVPRCDPPCVNSVCTSPNVCTCRDKFVRSKTDEHVCKPMCDENCYKHGLCARDNNNNNKSRNKENDACECPEGYVTSRNKRFKCVPDCGDTCSFGETCVAPGNCACRTGYKRINETCTPQCSSDCVNGYCLLPNVCECDDGFVLRDETCVSSSASRNVVEFTGGRTNTDDVALWCTLTLNKAPDDRVDRRFNLSFVKSSDVDGVRSDTIFSCYPSDACNVVCTDKSVDSVHRAGFVDCNITTSVRYTGRIRCYAINLARYVMNVMTPLARSYDCKTSLVDRRTGSVTYAFASRFSYNSPAQQTERDQCSLCPCTSNKRNVSIHGVNIEASICPCNNVSLLNGAADGITSTKLIFLHVAKFLYVGAIFVCIVTVMAVIVIIVFRNRKSKMTNGETISTMHSDVNGSQLKSMNSNKETANNYSA